MVESPLGKKMELALHCGLRIPTTPYFVPVLYLV
jgi:hypothetical protein